MAREAGNVPLWKLVCSIRPQAVVTRSLAFMACFLPSFLNSFKQLLLHRIKQAVLGGRCPSAT